MFNKIVYVIKITHFPDKKVNNGMNVCVYDIVQQGARCMGFAQAVTTDENRRKTRT